MNLIIRILLTAVLVMVLANYMPGVYVHDFSTSVIVAVVLALLNLFVKPILVLFTLPITILTLGLFLLIINAIIILLCTKIVDGFRIDSFWIALVFSILLSVFQSLLFGMSKEK